MKKLRTIVSLLTQKLSPVNQKTYAGWQSKHYNHAPVISFVIQSHNKSASVLLLVEKLRAVGQAELIVIDDGSTPAHTLRLAKFLRGANEFLLRCNDLYEIITYGRALQLARGRYVVLLQDDDDFDTDEWVTEGLTYFDRDELLVVLGGRNGARLRPVCHDGTGRRGPFTIQDKIAFRTNSFRTELYRDNKSALGFTYVQYVDRAPMWIRRELFLNVLRDFDLCFAPFQWDDAEVCLRAWTLGLRVGHYPAKFNIGGLGAGGMRLWNGELHQRQDAVNVKRVYDLYENQFDAIDSLVDRCNQAMAHL